LLRMNARELVVRRRAGSEIQSLQVELCARDRSARCM